MHITYRRKYGDKTLRKIMAWFHRREGLFEIKHMESAPQYIYVPLGVARGSSEHLVFLYLITSIMYRDDSTQTFRRICSMWGKCPEAFTENMPDRETLSGLIKSVGLGYYNDKARNWYKCGEALYHDFHGDPREMFRFPTVDAFIAWKDKVSRKIGKAFLPGYGPKTYSLLNIFFAEKGVSAVMELPDAMPVDRHIMRQIISWGIVSGSGVHTASRGVAEMMRKELARFRKKNNESTVAMSHALWLLGTHLCRRCPQVSGIEHLCPAHDVCGGRVHVALYGKRGQWNMDNLGKDARHPQMTYPFSVGEFLRE